MKKGILFLLLAASFSAKAQSLKDLLYSGKLKNDSNTVIRKTDDLSTKIDTTTRKKPAETQKTDIAVKPLDTSVKVAGAKVEPATTTNTNSANPPASTNNSVTNPVTNPVTEVGTATETLAAAAPVVTKTNTKLWKEYTDALAASLKTEVMNSKKIKKDTYFFTVEYELEPTGQVSITNLTVAPENDLLAAQVKQRIETTPPQMNADPNQTKKVKRRYSFSVTKD